MWGTLVQGGHRQHLYKRKAHITQRPRNVFEDGLLACHLYRCGFAGIHNGHNLLCPAGVI